MNLRISPLDSECSSKAEIKLPPKQSSAPSLEKVSRQASIAQSPKIQIQISVPLPSSSSNSQPATIALITLL
jgi:hypothetical protein